MYKNIYLWLGIGALIIIAIVVVSYYWGKSKVKPVQANYPDGGTGIPAGWKPEILANKLHEAMSGLGTFTGTKDNVWSEMYQLPTNDMFTAVYNVFNQLFVKENNGTLREWISNETYYDYLSGVKGQLLTRFDSLNLI